MGQSPRIKSMANNQELSNLGELNAARAQTEAESSAGNDNQTATNDSGISSVELLFVLMIAIVNDGCDYIGMGLEAASGTLMTPIIRVILPAIDWTTVLILGGWCLFRLKKFPSARFGTTMLLEFIPYFGDFSPTWTIFVITEWVKQRSPQTQNILKIALKSANK